MADMYIQNITVPKDASLWLVVKPDGTVHTIKNGDKYGPAQQPGKAIVIRTPNHDLIERPDLSLVPDYKNVRNGLKQAIKETKRDGRVIVGLPIELLKQTVVALDELRSVLRYFKNARVVVSVEKTECREYQAKDSTIDVVAQKVYAALDAPDRGTDNDWARTALEEADQILNTCYKKKVSSNG